MKTIEQIISYGVIEMLIALCVVILNIFVIVLFFKEKKLRKRKSNYLLLSQAFADLFLGLFAIPFTILVFLSEPSDHVSCMFILSLIRGGRAVSIYGIIAISFDRYKALTNPIEYKVNQSKTQTKVLILLYWFFGFLVGSLTLDWTRNKDLKKCHFLEKVPNEYMITFQFVTTFCPLIILIILYIIIYKNMKKVHETHVCERCVDVNFNKGECKIRRKESIATLNIIGIVLSFLICRIPLNILNIFNIYSSFKNFHLLNVLLIMYYLSAIINPLLYALRLKEWRKSCFKIFARKNSNARDFSSAMD